MPGAYTFEVSGQASDANSQCENKKLGKNDLRISLFLICACNFQMKLLIRDHSVYGFDLLEDRVLRFVRKHI